MRLTIPRQFQGIEGMAQGGHVAGLVASKLGLDVAVTFRAPCPLETPLVLSSTRHGHVLTDGDTVILEAVEDNSSPPPPPAVPLAMAEEARRWAETQPASFNISKCFSCGTGPEALRVHAGRVDGSSVYASPLIHPAWAGTLGAVEQRFLWAPIDCAAGWRVTFDKWSRPAVTGRLRVKVHTEVMSGEPLIVVADADKEWQGRKRTARSAIYRIDGTLVASSASLWIALP
jgi:hypothetical protein